MANSNRQRRSARFSCLIEKGKHGRPAAAGALEVNFPLGPDVWAAAGAGLAHPRAPPERAGPSGAHKPVTGGRRCVASGIAGNWRRKVANRRAPPLRGRSAFGGQTCCKPALVESERTLIGDRVDGVGGSVKQWPASQQVRARQTGPEQPLETPAGRPGDSSSVCLSGRLLAASRWLCVYCRQAELLDT